MPEPSPDGVEIWTDDDGRERATAYCYSDGNRRARIARLRAIWRNLQRDGWRCLWCGDPISSVKRADARYCREGCRKAHARRRRG
jgi:hypothetical protein